MTAPSGTGLPPAGPQRIGNASALSVLRRIASTRPAPAAGERCEMCAEPIPDAHQHVVDLESRSLLCTCRPCYLLFTDSTAHLRYRSVPDRFLSFEPFELGQAQWDDLEIPVGLAFFFFNSGLGRTAAFYPSPAGATESELPLDAWATVEAANPALAVLAPDTEALLIRAPGPDRARADCHLVPIDACYELVGRLRRVWKGFDGGQDARKQLAEFFDRVDGRSKPVPKPALVDGPARVDGPAPADKEDSRG
jgi:Family of unknown function (DUF5947)